MGREAGEAPEPLADVLARYLERAGLAARLRQSALLDEWARAVGPEIAAVTRAQAITDDGTMFVGVRTHAWMSELTLMERELLAALNRHAGDRPLSRLRWTLMR